MEAKHLQREFGGKWDGGQREVHGLINFHQKHLKIELLKGRETWVISVFQDGQCVASARNIDAHEGLRRVLQSL